PRSAGPRTPSPGPVARPVCAPPGPLGRTSPGVRVITTPGWRRSPSVASSVAGMDEQRGRGAGRSGPRQAPGLADRRHDRRTRRGPSPWRGPGAWHGPGGWRAGDLDPGDRHGPRWPWRSTLLVTVFVLVGSAFAAHGQHGQRVAPDIW